MLLLVFWSGVAVVVDPEKSLFSDTKYCSLTFFTKREKKKILIGIVRHLCMSRMFRKTWHYKILAFTTCDYYKSQSVTLPNSCSNLGISHVLGLGVLSSLEIHFSECGTWCLASSTFCLWRMTISLCSIKVLSYSHLFYIFNNNLRPIIVFVSLMHLSKSSHLQSL